MPKPAGTGNGNPFTGPNVGNLDALIRRNPRADQGGRLPRTQARRNMRDVVRIGDYIFSKSTIFRVTTELRLSTYRLPRGQAEFTMPAGGIQPWHTHPIALAHRGDSGAALYHDTDGFMTGNERQLGLQRPIPVGCVKIGVAHPRRLPS